MSLLAELKRRRMFRVAALYVVGAWMVLQVFDLLFPRLGIPDAVMDLAFVGALLGFPVALVFGWIYDITPDGIVRTQPIQSGQGYEDYSLRRSDYLILAALVLVISVIVYRLGIEVTEIPPEVDLAFSAREAQPNSIAVLPFTNMSSDPENEYFCDGVSEEILNRLSAIADLHVIARTSSFALKNSGFDVPKLAAVLGVRYLLQGSVRRDGNQLRISTQLLDQSGQQVWNTSFDREMEGIFDIQREISDSVATAIVPQIVTSTATKRIPDIDAYQHYLLGRELLTRRVLDYQLTAREHFEQAIEIDPEFAEPYAGLATIRALGAGWMEQTSIALARSQEYIDTALSLEPDLALAHAAQGLLFDQMVPPDTQSAEKSLRKALRLDPNLVIARNWLAGVLQRQGLEDEGLLELRRAVAIDPLAPVVNANLANDEAVTGNFRQAEQRLLRLLQVPKPSHMTFLSLRELYLNMGRLVDLNRMARLSALARARESGRPWHGHLAISYALLGMWRESDFWFERLEASDPNGFWEQSARLDLLVRQGQINDVSSITDAFLSSQDYSAEKITFHENARLGMFLALAGNYEEVVRRLNAAIDIHSSSQEGPENPDMTDPILSLAWASLQTGEKDKAQTIIQIMQDQYLGAQKLGRLHLSSDLAGFALTTQLAGNSALALERMQSAVDAGWRDYYLFRHDPRWASVRDEPGFVELMAFVKEDIERQRAEQEAIDASEDFEAQLASAMADHASRSAEISK